MGNKLSRGAEGGPKNALAEGRQIVFPSFYNTAVKVHPPGTSVSPGQKILLEFTLDLSFPARAETTKNGVQKFHKIARRLENHFSGQKFEKDLNERMLHWISSPETVADDRGGMDIAFPEVPELPEQTGVRVDGSASVSMRSYPNEIALASYFIQIPLLVFSAKEGQEPDQCVALEDLALNLAAHIQYSIFGGGFVQNDKSLEDDMFQLDIVEVMRSFGVIGLPSTSASSTKRISRKKESFDT